MDGMLSQDEINALLNGMASGEVIEEPAPVNAPVEESTSAQTEDLAHYEAVYGLLS